MGQGGPRWSAAGTWKCGHGLPRLASAFASRAHFRSSRPWTYLGLVPALRNPAGRTLPLCPWAPRPSRLGAPAPVSGVPSVQFCRCTPLLAPFSSLQLGGSAPPHLSMMMALQSLPEEPAAEAAAAAAALAAAAGGGRPSPSPHTTVATGGGGDGVGAHVGDGVEEVVEVRLSWEDLLRGLWEDLTALLGRAAEALAEAAREGVAAAAELLADCQRALRRVGAGRGDPFQRPGDVSWCGCGCGFGGQGSA